MIELAVITYVAAIVSVIVLLVGEVRRFRHRGAGRHRKPQSERPFWMRWR